MRIGTAICLFAVMALLLVTCDSEKPSIYESVRVIMAKKAGLML